MSTPEAPWNAGAPAPKASNRKLWWILGCAGFAGLALITVGVVATIVLPSVWRQRQMAQEAKVRADLAELCAVIEEHRELHRGKYPASWDELLAAGKKVPRDPWGHDYVLIAGEDLQTRPRLFSYGRDGVRGGEGEDADLEYSP